MNKSKLVNAYLNGDDFPDNYTIEDFENDPELMFLAIFKSGDKRLYDFCSDDVKKDYRFVNMMIRKFASDEKFICSIGDFFLDAHSDDKKEEPNDSIKICLLLLDKLKTMEYKLPYNIQLTSIYVTDLIAISGEVNRNPEFYGMGFNIFEDTYDYDKDILDYYSRKMVMDILPLNILKLERLMHSCNYKDQYIFETPPTTFLVNYVFNCDQALSDYISLNPNNFNDLANSIAEVQKNWLSYNNNLRKLKVECFYKILSESSKLGSIDFEQRVIWVYIANKYNLVDEFKSLNGIDGNIDFEIYEDGLKFYYPDCVGKNIYDQVNMIFESFEDKRYVINIEKIFNKIWNMKTREEVELALDGYLEDEQEKSKVVNLNNK